MNTQEQQALLTITLFAAFADGNKSDSEREEIRRIADALEGDGDGVPLARLYQDVLLKRVQLASATAALQDPGHRQLAYEMAVCVVDADGHQSEAETRFLATLRQQLRLEVAQAAAVEQQADAMLGVAHAVPGPSAPAGGPAPSMAVPVAVAAGAASAAAAAAATAATSSATTATPTRVTAVLPAEATAALDKSILNYAMLNGALELLPQSWASMAIIPLQIKMVYEVGQAHGVALDQGHIREFIAAAGVGLGSQYLEQFGRKLLGGLLGGVAGKMGRGIGGAATGMAFSFATTYALGQVAKRYYAGGRVMGTAVLRESFQDLLGPAKEMQQQYLPQIRQKAQTLDAGQIMAMVRGR
jgi:uncharacterized protein (DUF697 family)/uncharacterized tellurite resistance protein B-like protein